MTEQSLQKPPAAALEPTQSDLEAVSQQNIGEIIGEARSEFARVEHMDEATFDKQLAERTKAVEEQQSTSVNMSLASLRRMLEVGAHEPVWSHLREAGKYGIAMTPTSQGKDFHEGYFEHRARAEQKLAQYVNDGSEPVYAALATGVSEILTGASPAYGNVAIILREHTINPDSTVYTWGDSVNSSLAYNEQHELVERDPKVLTKRDAMTAKAIVDMKEEYDRRFVQEGGKISLVILNDEDKDKHLSLSAGYVESVLFQEVTPNMIEVVSISGATTDMAQAVRIIRSYPELAERALFVTNSTNPTLVKDYLAQEFAVVEATETHTVDESRWQALGLKSNDEPDVIARTLLQAATEALLKSPVLRPHTRPNVSANQRTHLTTPRTIQSALKSIRTSVARSGDEGAQHAFKHVEELAQAIEFFDAIT